MENDIDKFILRNISDLELLVLALLYADDKKKIRDDLFLQKELFLVVNYIEEIKDYADFIAHILGPYSEPVEYAIKNLLAYKLVEKRKEGFFITSSGENIFNKLKNRLSKDKIDAIEDFKKFLNDISKDELLVFVYISFPEFTTESGIEKRIYNIRVPMAISLYKKNKVSLEKASFLAGMPLEGFIELLRDHK